MNIKPSALPTSTELQRRRRKQTARPANRKPVPPAWTLLPATIEAIERGERMVPIPDELAGGSLLDALRRSDLTDLPTDPNRTQTQRNLFEEESECSRLG